MEPESELTPPEQTHEIIKKRKVIALTKGVFIALLTFMFFYSTGSTYLILRNQEKAADRILDCTVPNGKCYLDKVGDSQLRNAVELLSVVEFCSNKNPASTQAMEDCINKEIVTR